MKIQYASDLHLEFAENGSYIKHNPLPVTGETLLLAGDIGYLGDENYVKHPFWDWASENYRQVIVCMGNHEFYKYYDIAKLTNRYCLEIRHNVHSYYNGIIHLDDTDIIVSTLWGHIPLQEAYYTESVITDFRRILYKGEKLTFVEFNRECEKCVEFIQNAVTASKARHKIVMTHHVPSFRMQHPKFTYSKANGAFTVELEEYIQNSNIEYWIYGHSHYNVDMKIGNTQCVTNQLGYVFHNEHLTFNPGKFIEV